MIFLSSPLPGRAGEVEIWGEGVEADIITTSDWRQDIAEWPNISEEGGILNYYYILRSHVLPDVITAQYTTHMLLFICAPMSLW